MRVQTLLKTFLLVILFVMAGRQAEASHLYGSEFTYEYLGPSGNATNPDRYRFVYKIYTGNTGINKAVNFNIFTKDLAVNNNIRVINNVNPTTQSPNSIPLPIPPACTVANLPNIWIWTYILTVDLPISFNGYYMTASIGARNGDIDNLANPGGQNLYTYMEIPSRLLPSTSPVFTDTAVVVMFAGDTTTIINSAYDIDGDKLIYAFNQPFGNGPSGAGSTFVPSPSVPTRIQYNTPTYSFAQPFGPGGYASINASTGLAKYYVPNQGNYVVSFQVKEYRTINDIDVLIGTTIRDIQLVVRNAPANTNTKPTISHNGPPSKTITITEGSAIPPLTFTFLDPNPGQLLTITASSPLLDGPGGRNATLNTFNSSPAKISNVPSGSTATLNFTSVCGDAGTYPINLTVTDKVCGTSPHSETFQVIVTPYQGPDQIFGDTVVCSGSTKQYNVTAKASASYNWALQGGGSIVGSPIGDAIQINWTSTGRHKLTAYETSTGNCSDSVSFFVNVTPGITLTVSPPVTICAGSSPVNLAVSGGTSYTWTDGTNNYTGANITVNPTATTTYTVSSAAAGGCVATGSVTVTVNQLPTISPGNNRSICAGASTTLSATGAGTGGSYSWTDGTTTFANNASVTPTATTTYTVTGTTATNCTNTAQVTVTVTPLPIVNAGPDQTICTGTPATLSATGAATYSWTNGTNTFTGQSITVNPTTTTTYTVTGTANGCTSTDQVIVTVNPRPTVAGTDRTICAGQSTTLVATGADTYTWTSGSTTLTGNNVTVSPTATTTYTVTGTTTATGCTNTSTVTVIVNPLPTIAPMPNQTICAGGSATLSAGTVTGNMTHTWTDGTNTYSGNPVTVSPTATTTYTLTVLNVTTGCSNTATVTVTVTPLPVVTATASQTTICSGQSTILTATGADTYSWTDGTTTFTGASVSVSPTANTGLPIIKTYTVTGTNTTTNCTNTATVTVTVNFTPTLTVGNSTICIGETATLAAGSGASTYSWTDGTNTYTGNFVPVSPTTTTVYTVTGTTAAGCSNTAQLTVTVNPLPVLPALADQTICAGATATLSVGTAAANTTYSWTPSPTSLTGATVTVSPTTTTTYTVTATNTVTNCVNTATVIVTVNPLPVIPAITPQTICSGQSATLTVGTPAANTTYTWTGGAGTLTGASVTVSPTATTTYTVTATNTATTCTSTRTVTVTVNPLPVANAGTDKTICSGTSTTLGASSQAGHTYSWSPNLGLSSTTTANPTVTLTNTTTAPVNHTYTVTTTLNGCVTTDQVVVTVNPAITVDAGTDKTLCDLKSVVVGTPAIAGYTYSWAANAGLSGLTSAMPVFTASNTTANPVTIKLYVTATAFGCSKTDSVNVTINPRPVSDSINGNTSVCPGVQGVPYTVRNPRLTSYQWIVSGGTIASGQSTDSITVNWGAAGTGTVKVFSLNSFGCSSDTVTLPVTVNPLLITGTPTGPTQLCEYEAKNIRYQVPLITPGSIYTYQAFNGTITSANPSSSGVTVNWNGPGVGKLIVTETSTTSLANCFGVSDTLFVNVLPSPDTTIAISGTDKACEFTQQLNYTFAGSTNSTYAWTLNGTALSSSSNNVTIDLAAAGTYTLTVLETNAQGCPGRTITKTITATPMPGSLAITGPQNICPENMSGLQYNVAGLPGSTFAWTVNGSTNISGNGTSSITVDFDDSPNKLITVTETTADGCVGDPFTMAVIFDKATLRFDVASTSEANDAEVVLTLAMADNQANQEQITIYRRQAGTSTWTSVETINNTATTYTDKQANTSDTTYEYKLESQNECGTKLESNVHNTILLRSEADEKQGIVTLRWNRYKGWSNGVREYQIFRKLDNESAFTLVNLNGSALTDTTITLPATLVGFSQCYRIKAIGNDGGSRVSWSNNSCSDFENPLEFFNVITPDGDGLNEAFVIKNVELYKGSELTIMNRWGNEVFKAKDYKNTWKGDNVSNGVYYYLLKLPNGKTYKGWVEVIK